MIRKLRQPLLIAARHEVRSAQNFFRSSPKRRRTARGLGYLPASLGDEVEIILTVDVIAKFSILIINTPSILNSSNGTQFSLARE